MRILPLIAVAMFALIPVISASADPLGQPDHFSGGEFSAEVFLNRESIGYNITRLEIMVSEGSANRGINDSYLYRSHYDDDLYVRIRGFNLSGYLPNKYLPVKMTGPLVTLGVPVEPTEITLEMEYKEVDLSGRYFGPDQRWLLYDLGYHFLDGSQEILDGYGMSFGKEDNVISLEYSGEDLVLIRFMANDLDTIRDDAGALLSSMRKEEIRPLSVSDSDPWEEAEVEYLTWSGKMVRPTLDPEDVDWDEAMREELEWLKENGIITGLEGSDIQSISEQVEPGLSGPNNMILSFRGIQGKDDPEWRSYLDTTFTLITDHDPGNDDITIQSMPPSPTEEDQEFGQAYLLLIPGLILILVIGRIAVRYKAKNLLKNANRKKILDIVKKKHGIHFRELMRLTDLKQGSLSYHLNKMEKAELVKSRQDGMYRRFYPYNSKVDFRLALSDLQKDILLIILENPGINQSKISKKTGRNHVLVHYHANFLREAGMLWMEKSGRETKLFLTEIGLNMTSS